MNLVDNWILFQFERFAHWVQAWTGKDNFFLAKLCMVTYGGLNIWELYFLLHSGPWKWSYLQNYISFALGMYVAIKSNLHTLIAEQLTTPNFRNPLQITYRLWRGIYLGFLLMSIVYLIQGKGYAVEVVREVCFIAFLYLVSCTPMPPGESRAKMFLPKWVLSPSRN